MVNYSQFNESDAGKSPERWGVGGHGLRRGGPRRGGPAGWEVPPNNWFVLVAEEDYGGDKPKKVRAPPREPKHKRSKNSQDDR